MIHKWGPLSAGYIIPATPIRGERQERYIEVMRLRTIERMTYEKIAAKFGVTRERARQLHYQGVARYLAGRFGVELWFDPEDGFGRL